MFLNTAVRTLRYIFSLYIALIIQCLGVSACFEGLEESRLATQLRHEQFTEEERKNPSLVRDRFQALLDDRYFDDPELRLAYAHFLRENAASQEALDAFYFSPFFYGTANEEYVRNFIEYLSQMEINGYDLKEDLNEIFRANECKDAGTKKKYASQKKLTQSSVEEYILSRSERLFKHLAMLPTNKCYEMTLRCFELNFEACQCMDRYAMLVRRLYSREQDRDFSLYLQDRYAFYFYVRANNFKEARRIYEGFERSSCAKTACGRSLFNILGVCYILDEEYDFAISALENSLVLAHDPVTMKNLAFALYKANRSEEAIQYLYFILAQPDSALEENNVKRQEVRRNLVLILQGEGRDHEACDLLQEFQKKQIEKRLERVRHIRAQIARERKEDQRLLALQSKKTPPQRARKDGSGASSQTTCDSSWSTPASDKFRLTSSREKVKTRGVQRSEQTASSVAEPIIEEAPITIEQLLKEGSRHYQLFCEFFEHVEGYTTDRQVKISMHDVTILTEALGQDFDLSGGKGSHSKVTFDFSDHGIDVEEGMVTLSKKTYLLPYQIKAMREKFLQYGLYPRRLETILKKKMLLL